MFEIESVVKLFFFLLGIGCIFGLLFWLVRYLSSPGPEGEEVVLPSPFAKALRIFLAVALVLVLIGFILHVMGHPVVRW